MSIPKIIHQIWLGDKNIKPTNLIQTWIDMNPSWTHILWTEENMFELECMKQFNEMHHYSGKADILRYEILYRYGGFFIDADSECIRSLEDFLCDNQTFACYENEEVRPGLVANGYLACTPQNPIIYTLINHIKHINNINMYEPWIITGPRLLTKVIEESSLPFTIYPSHYFIPIHYTNIKDNSSTAYIGDDYVFAKQYWGTTLGYNNIKK